MRVVVKFHKTARDAYQAWQARLSEPPTGNAGVALIHAEEMIRRLEETDGVPSGAKFHPEFNPPCWVWRFSTDTWIRFVHKSRRTGGWGWGGITLEVVVTDVLNQPPV